MAMRVTGLTKSEILDYLLSSDAVYYEILQRILQTNHEKVREV